MFQNKYTLLETDIVDSTRGLWGSVMSSPADKIWVKLNSNLEILGIFSDSSTVYRQSPYSLPPNQQNLNIVHKSHNPSRSE